MPELPEVETYARYFARHALHQRIAKVEVRDERILGEIRKDALARRLRGREFESVRRHGKHLFADASSAWLHLHFGMTGDLAYVRDGDVPRFARVVFHFANGARLAFEDMRLFGLVDLVEDPDAYISAAGLGPDPLDPKFTFAKFAKLLERRKGAVKSLLMSQELVAGLGNLYVDEILYQTSIHPRRAVDTIAVDVAPENGTIKIEVPRFSYTPQARFTGRDRFTLTAEGPDRSRVTRVKLRGEIVVHVNP